MIRLFCRLRVLNDQSVNPLFGNVLISFEECALFDLLTIPKLKLSVFDIGVSHAILSISRSKWIGGISSDHIERQFGTSAIGVLCPHTLLRVGVLIHLSRVLSAITTAFSVKLQPCLRRRKRFALSGNGFIKLFGGLLTRGHGVCPTLPKIPCIRHGLPVWPGHGFVGIAVKKIGRLFQKIVGRVISGDLTIKFADIERALRKRFRSLICGGTK